MLTEQMVHVGDLELNVARQEGDGPPLLMLHGVTRRWQDFLVLMPTLATRWRLAALDFRGHGRSGRARGAYQVGDYLRDVVAAVDQLIPEPMAVYGHSLGALIAAGLAVERPDRVKALVLEDPPAESFLSRIRETPSYGLFTGMRAIAAKRLPVPEATRQLGQILFGPQRGGVLLPLSHYRDATSLRFTARSLNDLDPEVLTPLVEGRWLAGLDLEEMYHRVKCPALLLSGDVEYGGWLPIHDAEHVAALLHDGVHIHMPKVGHLIHWSHPDTTLRLVMGFLESL